MRNTIAIEGTSIPQVVADLAKEKTVTLFVDGDRGGQLIFKELMQKTDIDYVAVAPDGKEVEELAKKEVFKALRARVTPDEFKKEIDGRSRPDFNDRRGPARRDFDRGPRPFGGEDQPREERRWREPPRPPNRLKPEEQDLYKRTLEELVGTHAACIFDPENNLLGKVPASELLNALKTIENPYAIVFDGMVDFQLNMLAKKRGVKILVGMDREPFASPVTIFTKKDLE